MTLGPDGNIWVGVAGKLVKFPPSDPDGTRRLPLHGAAAEVRSQRAPTGRCWVSDTSDTGRLLNVKTDGTPAHDPYPTGGRPVPRDRSDRPGHGGLPINSPQQIGQLAPGGAVHTIDGPTAAIRSASRSELTVPSGWRVRGTIGSTGVTTDGQLTSLTGFPDVPGQGPRQITAGPGNTLWATLDNPGPRRTRFQDRSHHRRRAAADQRWRRRSRWRWRARWRTPPPDTTAPTVTGAKLAKTKVRAGTAT